MCEDITTVESELLDNLVPPNTEEVAMTPHPYYNHCSGSVKRFIVTDILPIARQYAVVYHSHETAEESNEPYKHAYEAREHLNTCLSLTNSILLKTDESEWEQEFVEKDKLCLQMLRNFLRYQIGKINNEVEEPHEAEPMLLQCFESMKHLSTGDNLLTLYCCVCNELGVIWCQRGEQERSHEYLTCGKNAYEDYNRENAPIHINELFCPGAAEQGEEARRSAWERTYTHTLYYLAQVYGHLKQFDKAALYCRRTLVRQLPNILTINDAIEWSFNAATLSNYYSRHQRLAVARHCIACAQVVFHSFLTKINLQEMRENIREKIERTKADIARFWISLARTILLESSRVFQSKVASKTEPSEDIDHIQKMIAASEKMFEVAERVDSEDKFEGIDVSQLESRFIVVTSCYAQASEVFKFAQEQVTIAHGFFKMDGYVTDHIEVLQDSSTLYKLLSMFEPNFDMKCRMHKRRIDMLEGPSNSLNTQYYLMVCRQMWYEIADTYMEMAGLKSDNSKFHISQAHPKVKQKYNKLTLQSYKYYQIFHDSIKPEKNGVYDIELIRPLVLSKMGMSKAKSNLLVDERELYRYMNEALGEYKWIVKYLDQHPDAKKKCESQYDLVKELSALLPSQIDKFQKKLI
ncbi:KIF1-binding protein-like [Oopsacas minuta]|uniref:KIF-binding protein n=1 Tax=Oopsacas minuta TaxID=111878 RepID=A0AAV7JY01_9METZ|nr:KIF1-binding protein-like [Oopsacas minuta]